jgi:hypothetical protein
MLVSTWGTGPILGFQGTKANQNTVPLYTNSYYYVFKEIKIEHSKINAYVFNKYSCICIKRLEMRVEKK